MLQPAPGPRGVPPAAQCQVSKQNCPAGQYCKGGICRRFVVCQDDSGCGANQCCINSGVLGCAPTFLVMDRYALSRYVIV